MPLDILSHTMSAITNSATQFSQHTMTTLMNHKYFQQSQLYNQRALCLMCLHRSWILVTFYSDNLLGDGMPMVNRCSVNSEHMLNYCQLTLILTLHRCCISADCILIVKKWFNQNFTKNKMYYCLAVSHSSLACVLNIFWFCIKLRKDTIWKMKNVHYKHYM